MTKNKRKKYTKILGMPTMLMLPAKNYKFKVDVTEHSITIPRKGKYVDLDDKIYTEEDGEFNILSDSSEDGVDNIFYMPSLTKVLFGVSKYPVLKDNQAFTPIAVVIKEKEVTIVGNIIEMLKEDE